VWLQGSGRCGGAREDPSLPPGGLRLRPERLLADRVSCGWQCLPGFKRRAGPLRASASCRRGPSGAVRSQSEGRTRPALPGNLEGATPRTRLDLALAGAASARASAVHLSHSRGRGRRGANATSVSRRESRRRGPGRAMTRGSAARPPDDIRMPAASTTGSTASVSALSRAGPRSRGERVYGRRLGSPQQRRPRHRRFAMAADDEPGQSAAGGGLARCNGGGWVALDDCLSSRARVAIRHGRREVS
jgi:hypothetical protein